ncbi:flagellar motor switch protein FliG, partial [bacterium]|nr:flagellar motor switch protein FliG [bacterium]
MSSKIGKKPLKGVQKAAILMITVGTEVSANILQNLQEDEIENVAREVLNMRNVDSERVFDVINEYYHMMRAQEYIAAGGASFAEELLKKSIGEERAVEFMRRLERLMRVKG